jgi:hypothetical protein
VRHIQLLEHFVNLTTPKEKAKYAQEVWDILQKSYEKIGGFKSATSPEELIRDSGLWKLSRRGGRLTAVAVYKDSFGRKSIASGTDGSTEGKQDYIRIKNEDLKFKRAWAEVSGPVEKVMQRSGAKPLPNKFAEILTGKKILELNQDGFHYTRMIAGHPHEKIIYGYVNLSPNDVQKFKAMGVEMHDLDQIMSK